MEQNAYNPPRFWWLKRITCAGIAYMIFLLAVRLWWGWEAQRRLDAAIEERRAAGQPVLLEDFMREPVADENNAAHTASPNPRCILGPRLMPICFCSAGPIR